MTITRYRTDDGAWCRNLRFAASRKRTGLVFVLCFCASGALGAQRPGARDPKNPNVKSDESFERFVPLDQETNEQRLTPLGVQVPLVPALRKQLREGAVESASDALRRLGISNGKPDQSRSDMVAEGTVTVYTASGPIAFGVTLVQNAEHGSQRILLLQPDGKLWDGRGEHLASGGRKALEFLETQHARGVQQLLDSPKRDAAIADNGINDASRVVTVLEKNGESTKYVLDPATSRIARFEFVRGLSRDSVGNVSPIVHSYAFADFRSTDGVATPFHIEHSVDGVKQEELQLTKARYHADATSAPAVRTKAP